MHVTVVRPGDRKFHAEDLDRFFAERHKVYAEELHWVEPSPTRRELDQFDTLSATYLLVMEGSDLIGGSRMIPTDNPHMLSEVFASTVAPGQLIRDPLAVEWTRGFIVADRREGGGLKLKAACCAAVMEYCLEEGFRQVGGIQDAKWLAIWKRMGWAVHKLGEPIDIGGEAWLPAYMDVSAEALTQARRWAGLPNSPILVWSHPAVAAE